MVNKHEVIRHRKCSECGAADNIVSDPRSGQWICACCGVVVDSRMFDSGPEWRAYDYQEEQDRSRGGSPLSSEQLAGRIGCHQSQKRGRRLSFQGPGWMRCSLQALLGPSLLKDALFRIHNHSLEYSAAQRLFRSRGSKGSQSHRDGTFLRNPRSRSYSL